MNSKLIAAAILLTAVMLSGSSLFAAGGGGEGGGGGGGFSSGGGGGGGLSGGGGGQGGGGGGQGGGGGGGQSGGGGGQGGGGGGGGHGGGGGGQGAGAGGGGHGNAAANYAGGFSYGHGVGGGGAGPSRSFYNQSAGARNMSGYQTVNRANQHATGLNQARQGNKALGQKAITTRDGRTLQGNWARNDPINKNRFDQNTQNRLRNWDGKKSSWAQVWDSRQRGHSRDWWNHHCRAIIFADSGWWGWYDGWWYEAWGYDLYEPNYRYKRPIYDFGGLPPDEVIANVQSKLQRRGYYPSSVDGIFGPLLRDSLRRYQTDHRLEVTGAIDPPTAQALGLTR